MKKKRSKPGDGLKMHTRPLNTTSEAQRDTMVPRPTNTTARPPRGYKRTGEGAATDERDPPFPHAIRRLALTIRGGPTTPAPRRPASRRPAPCRSAPRRSRLNRRPNQALANATIVLLWYQGARRVHCWANGRTVCDKPRCPRPRSEPLGCGQLPRHTLCVFRS